jgi:hypothetical protein
MDILDMLTKWAFKTETKPLDHVNEKLEKIQHSLEFLGAAEVVKGIFEIVERFSGMAEQLQSGAASAGLTVEALQRLQFAGSQSAVSAEEMTGALSHLTRTLYEARKGSKEATASFAAAGISKEQIAGFHTGADAMRALAERMKGMSDPIAKQGLAMQIMGRGSSKMVGFLSKGGAAMDAMGKEAEAMGAVLTGPQVSALADVEDALSAMGQVMKTFMASIAAKFAPAIEKTVHALLELYKVNRAFIETKINAWVYDMTFALGFVVGLVQWAAKKFFAFAAAHQDLVKWGGRVLSVLAAIGLVVVVAKKGFGLLASFLGPVVWLLKMMTGVGAVLARAVLPLLTAAFSPIGLTVMGIVAGLGLLILLVQAAWEMFHGKSFKDTWLGQMYDGVKGMGSALMGKLGLGSEGEQGVPALLRPDAGKGGGFLSNVGDKLGAMGSMMTGGAGLSGMMGQMAGGGTTYDMEAPININIPAGADPKEVGKMAKEGVKEHLDQTLREARRSLKPGLAY